MTHPVGHAVKHTWCTMQDFDSLVSSFHEHVIDDVEHLDNYLKWLVLMLCVRVFLCCICLTEKQALQHTSTDLAYLVL